MYLYSVCVYNVHIMENYSILKKKEIMSFVKTWMNLEGIMLCEINQTNTAWYHIYVESK